MIISFKQRSVLPGFGLTMGYTLLYLCLIVLIPLSGIFLKTATLTWDRFWHTVTDPRVLASYRKIEDLCTAITFVEAGEFDEANNF